MLQKDIKLSNDAFALIFIEIMKQNGLHKYIGEFEKFARLFLQMQGWHTNLTAIRRPEEVCAFHFADSLVLAETLPQVEDIKLLDVGSGGGFPALPVAIARPNFEVTALDSTAKKLDFISTVAADLSLKMTTLPGRAEELAHQRKYREKFDVVTARAVAALPQLVELCLPFVRQGGIFAAMKGDSGLTELDDACCIITALGGKVQDIVDYTLHCHTDSRARKILLIEKVTETPRDYPRAWSRIIKGFR